MTTASTTSTADLPLRARPCARLFGSELADDRDPSSLRAERVLDDQASIDQDTALDSRPLSVRGIAKPVDLPSAEALASGLFGRRGRIALH